MSRAPKKDKRGKTKSRATTTGAVDARIPAAPIRARAVVLLVLVTCLAYAPALRAPFQFDDVESIPGNATIRGEWTLLAPLHPPPGIAISGRPVVNYTLAINNSLNAQLGVDERPDPDGPNKTLGFHLVNLLVHLCCGALLFGIVRRTLRGPALAPGWSAVADPFAAIVTSLWLLHPIQSEAVNYVIQRTELIVSACYLGTLYAAIRAWDANGSPHRIRWYAVAIAACLLGMGSKEVMLTAPVIVVLYDRAFRSASWHDVLSGRDGRPWFYLLLVATSTWSISLIALGARANTVGFGLGMTWYQYLYSQAWAIAHYLRLSFWPDQLTFDYGQQPVTGLRGVPGIILLAALGVATVVAWVRKPAIGFVGAWFFLILAPSSSFVPIRTEIAAERRFYLPLASVLVLVATGACLLRRRAQSDPTRSPWRAPFGPQPRWAFTGLCLALAAGTFQRSRLYADPEALWRDAIAKAPSNARAYHNLAAALLHVDPPRVADAEAALKHAIAIDSMYLPSWPNLAALIGGERGREGEARQLLEHVLKLNPDYVRAVQDLGFLLVGMGEPAAALPYLERLAAKLPSDDGFIALGTAYMELGRTDDAVAALKRAISLNPARADAMSYLGSALTDQGRPADAIPVLEDAVKRDPGSGFALAALGVAYAQTGRTGEAIAAATSAGASGSPDPNVYYLAGRAMLISQRVTEAERLFRRALALQPGFEPARRGLAAVGRAGRR